jgi:hypothetical protein
MAATLFDLDAIQRQEIEAGTLKARTGRDIGQQQPLIEGVRPQLRETTPTDAALEGLTAPMLERMRKEGHPYAGRPSFGELATTRNQAGH